MPLFRSLPNSYFRFRWMALWPLHRRVGHVPGWGHVSLGEAVVAVALVVLAAVWCALTFPHVHGGYVASAYLLATYLLSMRNSVLTFLLGLSHERAVRWHAACAVLATAVTLQHGLVEHLADPEYMHRVGKSMGFITGWVGFGVMAIMVATSIHRPALRARMFNTWQWLHRGLLLAFFVVVMVHADITFKVGSGLWFLDLLIRYVYMAGLKNPRRVTLTALPGSVVRVSWEAEGFKYAGGQYVFLNIPSLSWAEFHPFSLSSAPGCSALVHCHVRALGDWTQRLHDLATKDATPGKPKEVKAFIEGPYGSPSVDLYGSTYKAFLLVSGGIGVTPMQSVFNHLLAQRARGRPVRVARLVWAVRDKAMIGAVAGFDVESAHSFLPGQLPLSFQPDLISPNLRPPSYTHLMRASSAAAAASVPMKLTDGRTVTASTITTTTISTCSSSRSTMGSGPGPAQEAQLADNERLQQQGQHQEEQQQQQKSQEDECSSTSEPSEGTNDSGSNAQPPCGDGATGPTDATAVAIQQGSDDFISTEFYLTQSGSQCGKEPAPLHPCVRLGRPPLEQLMRETAALAAEAGERRVAVLVCGPDAMVSEVRALAARYGSAPGDLRVVLDVHSEVFAL